MAKNRLYIPHPEIVTFRKAELSDNLAAGSTTGSVINNIDFASNNLILIGEYGKEEAEIVTCSGITGNTQVNFSTTKFAHAKGTVITKIEYNQYVLDRSTTETGTFSSINTANLAVDEFQNMFVDITASVSSWYKYRYYDTALVTYSDYSDPIQVEYKENSLHGLKEMIRLISGTEESEENLRVLINWYQRKICGQYNYGFMETATTTSSVASQVEYSIPDDCKIIKGIRVTYGSSYYYPQYLPYTDFRLIQLNTSSTTMPSYWTKIGNKIEFHNPFSALGTDNIRFIYYKFPARLDSDNDVTPLPMADALVNRVAYGLLLGPNPSKAQMVMGDYQGALNELKAIYGVDQMESFPRVGYGEVKIEEIIEIDTT